MISLSHVFKTYQLEDEEVKVLKDINIEIKDGGYASVVGPSGCGKSTLMHIMGLLDSPTSGSILLNNKDVSKLTDEELSMMRNRNVGFVFQSFNLINKFTVLENVLMPSEYVKGKLDFDHDKRAEELLKKVGIWERRNFFPNRISGGQQQRASIARALLLKPTIIFADEPTGNLDSKTGKEIMDLLENLNKEMGVTLVVVTHEPELAIRAAQQIYIQDGEIVKKK